MTWAVVLGGGGPVGSAWYAGLALGLAEQGVALGEADLVIGTSAGASAGAWCASGRPLAEYVAAMSRLADDPDLADLPSEIDLDLITRIYAALSQAKAPLSPTSSREICDAGLTVGPRGDQEWYVRHHSRYLPDVAWPTNFRAVAVRADDGQVRLFGPGDDLPLARGVAASAAAPGIISGVRIGKSVYFDGGARSATNADLVRDLGVDRCLVVSPLPADAPMVGEATRRVLNEEVAALRAEGIAVAVMVPGDLEAAAFGWDLLNLANIKPAIDAGYARGKRDGGAFEFL